MRKLPYVEELACSVAFVALVACLTLFRGCAAHAQGPAVEFIDTPEHPAVHAVYPQTVFFVEEVIVRRTAEGQRDFKLADTDVVVDSVNGTISFPALSGCDVGNKISTVGYLSAADGSPLVPFDLSEVPCNQVPIPVSAVWPGGIKLGDRLILRVFDDDGHPTDLRLALSFHRKLAQ